MAQVPYSGDVGSTAGNLALYVIDPNGNFLTTIRGDSNTTQYFTAGGASFAAGASLLPFKSNILFKDFARNRMSKSNALASSRLDFSAAGSKVQGATSGITGSVIYSTTRDPRATHIVSFGNNNLGISIAGMSHMDELVFTSRTGGSNIGSTLQAFFGGFFDGTTTGVTNSIQILYPGTTGAEGITSFEGFTFAGASLMAQHVKSGSTASVAAVVKTMSETEVLRKLISQAADFARDQNNIGLTMHVNYGTAGLTAVFVAGDTETKTRMLSGLIMEERLFALNNLAYNDAANIRGQAFFPFLSDGTSRGLTIDGVSGGTNSTSQLQSLIANMEIKFRTNNDTIRVITDKLKAVSTIRELVNIVF